MSMMKPKKSTDGFWNEWLSVFDDTKVLDALSCAMRTHERIVASSLFKDGVRRVAITDGFGMIFANSIKGDEVFWDECTCGYKKKPYWKDADCTCTPTTRTLLHLAVQLRVQGLFDAILTRHKDLVNVGDVDGRTPLFFCLSSSDYSPLEPVFRAALIAAGAHIDQRDTRGKRLLLHAMDAGHVKTVRELIERGAAPLTKDDWKEAA